jgi:lipopolysaccharide/colanic/teichoic acid biosynthesis glycosyltransferase
MNLWAGALMGRVAALLILICLLPLNLLIALALRILQGPNILFFQQRSGFGGQPFNLVKFRTMRDLRDDGGQLLDDAARVTTIGIFLRKTRLDELPSFWNVVIGELAFIGPRPLLPCTVQTLGDRGVKRGTVRPGLTGWAQISGNTLLTLDEKVTLDLWYIEHRSWRMDIAIIAGTLRVMIAGEKRNSQRS